MRTTAHTTLIVASLLAAGCTLPVVEIARAQPGSGQPAPSGRFVASLTNDGMVQVQDTTNNFMVIAPSGLRPVANTNLVTVLEFHPADDGADIVIHYANTSSEPQDLGSINVAGMRLDPVVQVGDFRHDAKFAEFDSHGGRFTTAGWQYPQDLYSPVGVIRDSRYTVGMSLQYPILDYKHGVRVNFHVPGGAFIQSGFNWNGEFILDGQLQPGQTREYTLSFRVVDNQQNWLETLVPYRDYFQQLYGAVRYQRDPRPVMGYFVGMNAAINSSNPYGFDGSSRRPDLNGWGPWADYVYSSATARGFRRVMMWAPSGMFRVHQDMNYPFQFMTGMDRNQAVRDSAFLLRQRIADRGVDLGFWWGRSSMVMRQWDTDQWEPLNPDNPDHVQRAMAELDLAVERGATLIGLDAFVYADQWDGYRWLQMMHERHPEVKFVIEPSACDFQHVLAATWVEGLHHIQTPPILQDFLVPGHETWANTRMDLYHAFRGITPDDAIKNAYWKELSDEGYVVVSYEVNTSLANPCLAAEGWLRNIPVELRSDPRAWTAPGGGSTPTPDPGGHSGGSGGTIAGSGGPPPNPAPPSGGSGPNPAGGSGAGGGSGGGSGAGGSGGASGSTPPPPDPAPASQPPPRVIVSNTPPPPRAPRPNAHSTTRPNSNAGSVRQRIEERRATRRLSSLTDEQWQKRKERRARLVQRLGLSSMVYRDRVAALRSYREARAAERLQRSSGSTLATHPDGQ